MVRNPKVSIIVPTFNREETIERSLRSILAQTLQDFEVIVVDDHSQDRTGHVVQDLNDERILYLRNERNLGAQGSRNRGITSAKGEYIAFLDSDDEYLPEKLEAQINLMKSRENIGVVHCDAYRKYETNGKIERLKIPMMSGNILRDVLKRPGPMFQGMVIRNDILRKNNVRLDETIVSYQEWDTAIMLAKFCEFEFIDEPLFIYHIHAGDTISKNDPDCLRGYLQVVRKHSLDIKMLCGLKTMAEHYVNAFTLAYESGEVEQAKKFLLRAIVTYPISWSIIFRFLLFSVNRKLYRRISLLYLGWTAKYFDMRRDHHRKE